MWVPPGQKSDHTKWRFDVAQKSFIPPGTKLGPKGTQVEMPMNYQGNEPTGFHMVASPAGTQAPIQHINYTPETGEVHGRGMAAPPHMLNYTLMPEDALGAGAGQGSSPAMGMGADTVPGQVGAFPGTPPIFAGTPASPLTGPSPTSSRSVPAWGGGGRGFDQRMGMGQMGAGDDGDDVITGIDPTQNPGVGGGGQPAPAQSGGTPAPAPAQGGTPAPGNGIPAPGYPQGIPKGTPQKEDGTYYKLHEPVPIHGEVGVIGYQIYEGVDIDRKPIWKYDSGQTNASEKDRYQTFNNNDGTVTIVDFSQKPPAVTKSGMTDPGIAAKATADAQKQKLENQKLQLEIDAKNATSDADRQAAVLKIQQLQLDIQKAQSEADKAAIEAGMAGKPKVEAKPNKLVGKDREIFIYNPDTDHYDSTGTYEPSEAGDWEKYMDPKTQTWRLLNKNTHEDFELAPVDSYKEYPPQKGANGKWIQWDPGKQTFKTVFQEDADYTTQWSGDELIAVNKNNPSDVKTIWQKKLTTAEKDAHEAAIDAHNKALIDIDKTKEDMRTGRTTAAAARVTMEKDLQEILHPKPIFSPFGDVFAPPGLTLNMQDWNPMTGERGTRSISGGPVDPRIDKMIGEIDAFLAGGPPPTTEKPPPTKAPFDTSAPDQANPVKRVETTGGRQTNTDTTAGERTDTVGSQMGGQDIRPGYPGYDPQHLGGQAQPPTNRTTSSGDIAHYDETGTLTGIDYINTAPPGYEEGQGGDAATEEYFDPETGKRNPAYGMGNMGAGMAAGGTGWAPRPGMFAPATGPGFLGAGAEPEQEFYDAEGNPIVGSGADNPTLDELRKIMGGSLPTGISGTTTAPLPLPGGHAPPLDVKPPKGHIANPGEVKPEGPSINVAPKPDKGITDEGAKWVPDLKDIVTQKVNEPLKKLLGWPKLETLPPTEEPLVGTQGGFDQPENRPLDIRNKQLLNPQEPSDVRDPNIVDFGHAIGEGGTGPADWEEMQQGEGIGREVGRNPDPETAGWLDELRDKLGTLGVGQEPGDTMPMPGGQPGVPPQGPGGEQPPAWLLTLLRAHPELLQMAGLSGAPAGGAPPSAPPPTAAAGAPTPPTPPDPLAGGAPPSPTPAPSAGWTPPGGPPGAQPPPGGAPGGPPPVAPSPEGGPMTPPLPPEDVAGIGHRFGQSMSVGEPQHSGVDLQAPEGTPTKSPVDGFVTRVENNPDGLGNTVVIQGMDGSEHRLGHLQSVTAYPGQQVKMGQDLGSPVGETGLTTGAHLHWGVKDGQGQPADPTQALGPMANMPPVPGTEMMGPPGGVGGGAQQGAPQMGGGHVGAGATDFSDWRVNNQPSNEIERMIAGGTGPIWPGEQQQNPAALPRLGKVQINPTEAFGTGQEKAGWKPGAGAAPVFNPLGATSDTNQRQESQGRQMSVGQTMTDYTTPAGGRGAMPQPQRSPFPPQQQQGGQRQQQPPTGQAQSFATAGAMPTRQPQQPGQQQQRNPQQGMGQEGPPGWQPSQGGPPPGGPPPGGPPPPQGGSDEVGQALAGSLATKGGAMPPGGRPQQTGQPAPQGEQNPALAQPGAGQDKGKKGKRKKAGWTPRRRMGSGQVPPMQPGQPPQGQPPQQGQMSPELQQMLMQIWQQMQQGTQSQTPQAGGGVPR